MTPAEHLAALQRFAASRPEPRRPVHPETGCFCSPCIARDDHLEALAESRRDAREGR